MDKNSNSKPPFAPSELRQASKFEWAMQLGARNLGLGAVVGSFFSMLLFRSPAMRFGATGLAAGAFSGWSAKIVHDEFEKPPK